MAAAGYRYKFSAPCCVPRCQMIMPLLHRTILLASAMATVAAAVASTPPLPATACVGCAQFKDAAICLTVS